jgi:hypothetical protein
MGPLRNLGSRLGCRQCIDDAAQEHRFGKLCGCKGNVGDRQPPGQWSLGAEQSENAPIETKNIHARRKLSQPNIVRAAVGLLTRTALGRSLTRRSQNSFFDGLPQYRPVKRVAEGLARIENGENLKGAPTPMSLSTAMVEI